MRGWQLGDHGNTNDKGPNMQRTKPPFRADHVGSLLRPAALKEAREKHAKGEIDAAALKAVEDRGALQLHRHPPVASGRQFGCRATVHYVMESGWSAYGQHECPNGGGPRRFDVSLAQPNGFRVETSWPTNIDHLDGLPLRWSAPVVSLSFLWAQRGAALYRVELIRVSAMQWPCLPEPAGTATPPCNLQSPENPIKARGQR
jgi:hypothetical protein